MAGSIITLEEGSNMTADFRAKFPNESKAVFYSSNVFTELLSQEGCIGIRMYNALNEGDKLTNVLVGVDEDGNDLIHGKVYNKAVICPDYCSKINSLNS